MAPHSQTPNPTPHSQPASKLRKTSVLATPQALEAQCKTMPIRPCHNLAARACRTCRQENKREVFSESFLESQIAATSTNNNLNMDNSNTARNSRPMDMVLLRHSNMVVILSRATHHRAMRLRDTGLVLDTEVVDMEAISSSSPRRRVEELVRWVVRHWVLVVD
jgi:hypothetical protein